MKCPDRVLPFLLSQLKSLTSASTARGSWDSKDISMATHLLSLYFTCLSPSLSLTRPPAFGLNQCGVFAS